MKHKTSREVVIKKSEKMKVMEDAVGYARSCRFDCLNCIETGDLYPRGGNASDVKLINDALSIIGLDPKVVDEATAAKGIVDGGGPLGLATGNINGCTRVDAFLNVVEQLL